MTDARKTLGQTFQKLKEKWGNFDSNILLSDEVKNMDPEQRKEYLDGITDLYIQADSEGNCEFYEEF